MLWYWYLKVFLCGGSLHYAYRYGVSIVFSCRSREKLQSLVASMTAIGHCYSQLSKSRAWSLRTLE